jgi:hypothetical protein
MILAAHWPSRTQETTADFFHFWPLLDPGVESHLMWENHIAGKEGSVAIGSHAVTGA